MYQEMFQIKMKFRGLLREDDSRLRNRFVESIILPSSYDVVCRARNQVSLETIASPWYFDLRDEVAPNWHFDDRDNLLNNNPSLITRLKNLSSKTFGVKRERTFSQEKSTARIWRRCSVQNYWTPCAGNWFADRTVYNNSSLSFRTRRYNISG